MALCSHREEPDLSSLSCAKTQQLAIPVYSLANEATGNTQQSFHTKLPVAQAVLCSKGQLVQQTALFELLSLAQARQQPTHSPRIACIPQSPSLCPCPCLQSKSKSMRLRFLVLFIASQLQETKSAAFKHCYTIPGDMLCHNMGTVRDASTCYNADSTVWLGHYM